MTCHHDLITVTTDVVERSKTLDIIGLIECASCEKNLSQVRLSVPWASHDLNEEGVHQAVEAVVAHFKGIQA